MTGIFPTMIDESFQGEELSWGRRACCVAREGLGRYCGNLGDCKCVTGVGR